MTNVLRFIQWFWMFMTHFTASDPSCHSFDIGMMSVYSIFRHYGYIDLYLYFFIFI